MHVLRTLLLVLLASAGAWSGAATALGTEFTYQGELRDGGIVADGDFDFRYSLHSAASGATQVGSNVFLLDQPVDDGLFTHRLDFGDVFTGAELWLAVAVRRVGEVDYTVLEPRQALTAAPYALHAEFVADNSVVGSNIVDRSITAIDIASGVIGGNEIANGGVGSADLADGSVTEPKLAASAVSTVRIADGAVTAAKLASGAIGAAQVNPAQIQLALSGTCGSGVPLLGIGPTGSPVCDDALHVLDGTLRFPSLALRVGARPYIASVDPVADDLVLALCDDLTCSTGSRRVVLDTDVGDSGAVAVLDRGAASFPFVAYHDRAAGDLHAIDCNNIECSSSSFRSLDTAGDAGIGLDVALRSDGRPVVSYISDGATPTLKLYICSDADCSSGVASNLDGVDVSASRTAIVLDPSDVPTVFYKGSGASAGLNVYSCSSPACGIGFATVINADDVFGLDAVRRSDGRTLLSYAAELGSTAPVRVLDCSGASCTTHTVRTLSANSSSYRTSIGLRGSAPPLVAYLDASSHWIYDCADAGCASGTAYRVAGSNADLNGELAVAISSSSQVMVASEMEVGGEVRVRLDTCGNPRCAQ